jgi:hypothetical protein
MSTLIEGRDYYIEKGKYVFTTYYLKARGYCCHNGCRHCPYMEVSIDERPLSEEKSKADLEEKA